MKQLLALLIMMASAWATFAQEDTDLEKQNPKAQEKIQAARIALISEKLKLTPAQAEKFWPIYREFSEQRMELRKQFRQAERNPEAGKTQAEREKALLNLSLQLKQQNVDLEKKYSDRLLNIISAQQLLTLPKAEEEFRRMLIQRLQDRQEMREQRKENMRNRLEQRQREKNN